MNANFTGQRPRTLVADFLKSQGQNYQKAIFYSFIIGIIYLSPTIFMLEVYDRVVNSRN